MTKISTYERKGIESQYVNAGFVLFGCDENKEPLKRGWRTKETSDPQLPPYYGVKLEDCHLVLDIDPRRFDEGDNSLARLLEFLEIEPNTFMVNTKSNGIHIYFKKPENIEVISNLTRQGYPGIEIKTVGQYVIGAGSPGYEIMQGSPTELEFVPAKLLRFLENENAFVGASRGIESDDIKSIQSYIAYLKNVEPAIEGAGGDAHTLKVAMQGRDYGLSEGTVYACMEEHFNIPSKCVPLWESNELLTKVENAFKYARFEQGSNHPGAYFEDLKPSEVDEHGELKLHWDWEENKRTGKMEYKHTFNNAFNFFFAPSLLDGSPNPLPGLVSYNRYSKTIQFNKPAPWHREHTHKHWTDRDTIMLNLFFSQKFLFNVSINMANNAVEAVADTHSIHPVMDYLNSLEWDRRPRLDKLLPYYACTADTAYTREVGKNAIIAACARIFEPGCQHDTMVVLEGDQGIGKSSFVRILGGNEYAAFSIDPHNKDTLVNLLGAWFVEIEEMEFTRRTELNAMKAFVSRPTDTIRMPYDRRKETVPRSSTFWGTVNPDKDNPYLSDRTGNRRFLPVYCAGKIKREELARDRDQIFAEAMYRYRKGEEWHITNEDIIKMAQKEQQDRMGEDPWVAIVSNFLDKSEGSWSDGLTLEQLGYACFDIRQGKLSKNERTRLTDALLKCGWDERIVTSNRGRNTKVFMEGFDV